MENTSSLEGFMLDPSKCSKLSMDEKRELVYALSKWSHGAPEMLQSWSRQEILEILCVEMGKERKYTGLTKLKIIEQLLKIVSEKKSQEHSAAIDLEAGASSEVPQRTAKRQRKTDNPTRLPVTSNVVSTNNVNEGLENDVYCQNSACRARLSHDAAFCKRCSCCICRKYDDNKDPSLWLICSSEPPFQGVSCGMSCHLDCALRHERSGIVKDKLDRRLDGSFYCVACGKMNDILGSWRKQLLIARDTRRVDILCYRVSLCRKILTGTKRYQMLYDIVNEAVKKLEADVGPLTGLPVKMARGIVNRLSSGPEVQRLCAFAIDLLDTMLSERAPDISACKVMGAKLVTLEDVCTSSVTVTLRFEGSSPGIVVGYTLWHRKYDDLGYPAEPTCTLFAPNSKFHLSSLSPDTDYFLKVISLDSNRESGMCEISFRTASSGVEVVNPNSKDMEIGRSESPTINSSSLSNPSSMEDETNHVIPCSNDDDSRGDNYLDGHNTLEKMVSSNLFNSYTDNTERGITGETISLLDEEHSMGKICSVPNTDAVNLESKPSPDGQMVEETSTDNGSNTPRQTGLECVPLVGASEILLPITPYKLDKMKDGLQRSSRPKLIIKDLDNGSGKEEEPQAGSSSKKRRLARHDDESAAVDKDFEYYVKVIRWLECDGHIETGFRKKFLTWYSLRATPQEVRIVKVFVDTFIEDPESLAEQLVDTFSDVISNKRSTIVPGRVLLEALALRDPILWL
ncbi:hypothetical protein ACH5RR_003843 [Cinchona calisaya]|uniref:Fibronectin type-III domain-containing protein n=1 Tax=Cinchona calisaya TaxID=153742 RepID=A0ABD3AVY8_9GENT